MRAAEHEFFSPDFLAFAHRGGALYPPNLHRENTLHAFREADALGYRYLETDVHATADGVLLAFHDDRLDRVTDRTGVVAEMDWAEVSQARIHGLDPIPTLDELLEAFPRARFNIDAKSATAVDLLADAVEAHGAHDRVCLSSFGRDRLHRLRARLGPRVATSASSVGVAAARFLPWLHRVVGSAAPAFQVPVRRRLAGRVVEIVTPGLLRTAHRAGQQVHVWTVDDRAEIERLLDLGVDGVFTDRPDVLRDVLRERGRWA